MSVSECTRLPLLLRALLLPGALLLLLRSCPSTAIGPPPGARGTIDWRYPDAVMTVPMPCSTNGTFRHPVYCNWYYRCYDPHSIGYYRRAFFECEPGTVFLEDLQQCVGGGPAAGSGVGCIMYEDRRPVDSSSGSEPVECSRQNKDCKLELVCPPVYEPVVTYAWKTTICTDSNLVCSNGTTTRTCPEGTVWDSNNESCLPYEFLCDESSGAAVQRAGAGVTIECDYYLSDGLDCTDGLVCPKNPNSPVPVRSCKGPMKQCHRLDTPDDKKRYSSCVDSDSLNLFTGKCDRTPINLERQPGCSINNGLPVADGSQCSLVKRVCRDYTACSSQERFSGCSHYYYCTSSVYPGAEKGLCKHGELWFAAPGAAKPVCLPARPMPTSARQTTFDGSLACIYTGLGPIIKN